MLMLVFHTETRDFLSPKGESSGSTNMSLGQ